MRQLPIKDLRGISQFNSCPSRRAEILRRA
jgi:hypothetical protein